MVGVEVPEVVTVDVGVVEVGVVVSEVVTVVVCDVVMEVVCEVLMLVVCVVVAVDKLQAASEPSMTESNALLSRPTVVVQLVELDGST